MDSDVYFTEIDPSKYEPKNVSPKILNKPNSSAFPALRAKLFKTYFEHFTKKQEWAMQLARVINVYFGSFK